MLLWSPVHKYLFETLFSVPLAMYPEVELLVILILIFRGEISILICIAAEPWNDAQGFWYFHILINT